MGTDKFTDAQQKRSPSRGLSIQQRLPLLIGVLLLVILVTFSCISYVGVKNAALNTGKERLRALTDQLSSLFSQSAQGALIATRVAANQEPIKKYLSVDVEPTSAVEAMQALDKLRSDSTWVVTELLDADHIPVLHSARDGIQPVSKFDSVLSSIFPNDPAVIGKIYMFKDSLYYPIIMPVVENKQVIGHLVRWKLATTTAQALEQFSQLMGTQARLYVGNTDGSLWTDLIKQVNYVKLDTGQMKGSFEHTDQERKSYIAAARPIANTSWLVSVEFPKKVVLESASRFLQWVIIIGSLLIIAGVFIGWLMTRSITKPLKKLTAAASAIEGGNYSTTVQVDRRDEVGELARAFNAMIGEVSNARDGLEQKIMETAEMNEQLRSLSAYLQNVREDERIHISREMHDELGQLLTGFKMDVSWLRKRLTESNDPAIQEKLVNMLSIVDESVKFVRKLATDLRPSILDDLGLVAALEWHSREFEKRYNIGVDFHSELHDFTTAPLVATGLFRMYQESLTNVARHSNATKVIANLRLINDQLSLSVIDNGKGFDTSSNNKKTLGLLGMKERAAMIGGKLEIISQPGKGTSVIVSVQLPITKKVSVL